MEWYDAVKTFLYIHPWFQALLFGSMIAVIGGGSFLHRRKERRRAKELVETNREANKYREEANRLSAELLEVHRAIATTMQPEKDKIKPRLLKQVGKSVMVQRESYRVSYNPSAAILGDVNEDSVILKADGSGQFDPYHWPLSKVAIETDPEGRFLIVLDDRGSAVSRR